MKFQCSIQEELDKITNNIGDLGNCKWLQRIDSLDFIAVDNAAKALEETDTVITTTPSRKAYISNEWVMPGTHFSCIGADMSGKQEIDEKIFGGARVFVDVVQASPCRIFPFQIF
ncbi:hypothetical protein [Geosporobacter ferrireducens]|uniref:hypothetical protein n=1 Tax=Geosporobacter ferrireducens TaxID=1424294 RepID=UPI0023528E1C|nr:hypothetical protein [Geosporobacter ferrireducens]